MTHAVHCREIVALIHLPKRKGRPQIVPINYTIIQKEVSLEGLLSKGDKEVSMHNDTGTNIQEKKDWINIVSYCKCYTFQYLRLNSILIFSDGLLY